MKCWCCSLPVLCESPPISTLRMCKEAPKLGCKQLTQGYETEKEQSCSWEGIAKTNSILLLKQGMDFCENITIYLCVLANTVRKLRKIAGSKVSYNYSKSVLFLSSIVSTSVCCWVSQFYIYSNLQWSK